MCTFVPDEVQKRRVHGAGEFDEVRHAKRLQAVQYAPERRRKTKEVQQAGTKTQRYRSRAIYVAQIPEAMRGNESE